MRYFTLITLITASQALLLPPNVASPDFQPPPETKARVFSLDCTDCPVQVSDLEGHAHDIDTPSRLHLPLAVEHGDDGPDILTLNGLQIWPPHFNVYGTLDDLTLPQMAELAPSRWQGVQELDVGYRIMYHTPHQLDGAPVEYVTITMEILRVADTLTPRIDAVEMQVMWFEDRQIFIMDVEAVPKAPVAAAPAPEACEDMSCRVQEAWKHMAAKVKGCGHGRGRGRGRGHGHGHHYTQHALHIGSLLKSIALHLLAGVLVGFLGGLLALVLLSPVIVLYRVLQSRRQRYARVESQDHDEDDHSEDYNENYENYDQDSVLVVHRDTPPQYEESKTIVEEKV